MSAPECSALRLRSEKPVSHLRRPDSTEHAEYYQRYIDSVPDGDIVETLRDQLEETLRPLQGLPEEAELFRYAPGKWNLREVLTHILDTERVFAYRALTMARQENADLPGMDQDQWVAESNASDRPLSDLMAEWIAVRRSNVHLFAALPEGAGARLGRASGYTFSVRALAWMIAGHELWHRGLIAEHYLGGRDG